MLRTTPIAVAISLLLLSVAEAAVVQALDPTVYLNRGEGFRGITGATQAQPGDLVMAGPGGRGQIIYDNGCREIVEPGTTVTIKEPPPKCRGAGGWLIGAGLLGGIAAGIIFLGDDDDDGRPKPVSP
jgi:hypothetical protein